MSHHPISFFIDKIRSLRFSAQLLYDKGIAQGMDQEQVFKQIEPITDTITDFTRQAVSQDLRGLIYGVKSLQNEASAHRKDVNILIEKEMNTRTHIEKIENQILAEMRRQEVNQLIDGDFTVVLTEEPGGKHVLTYR